MLSAATALQAYTAWDEVHMAPPVECLIGLTFSVKYHTLFEVSRSRDPVSHALPWRAPADGQWEKVDPGECFLVGLAGVIVLRTRRRRLFRASIRESLKEISGLTLNTGVIDQVIREAGPASLPLENTLVANIVQGAQLDVDQSSWPESAMLLWALVTTHMKGGSRVFAFVAGLFET